MKGPKSVGSPGLPSVSAAAAASAAVTANMRWDLQFSINMKATA